MRAHNSKRNKSPTLKGGEPERIKTRWKRMREDLRNFAKTKNIPTKLPNENGHYTIESILSRTDHLNSEGMRQWLKQYHHSRVYEEEGRQNPKRTQHEVNESVRIINALREGDKAEKAGKKVAIRPRVLEKG